MSYSTIPYTFEKTGTDYKTLIVAPQRMKESILENGLINPERENPLCEAGIVIASDQNSTIKPGDEVFYNKIDRVNDDHLDTIDIDGQTCDFIYENEVWCCNEKPIGRIFVEQYSDAEITNEGLIIPDEVRSVTQKGKVFAAPPDYLIKEGDQIEFRKQEQGIFSETIINDKAYTVLYEADVFKVNGHVAPFRIIVKIDMFLQALKRMTSDSGIALSQLFQFMKYNLQYGEVQEIGSEAQKLYPDLRAGDTVILHHAIEAQPYRIVGKEVDKNHQTTYEYRAINCWDARQGTREIFGKLTYKKATRQIINITPFNDSVFLKWEFNVFDLTNASSPLLENVSTDITKLHDLDSFRNTLSHLKHEAAEKAKAKTQGVKMVINNLDPEYQKDLYNFHVSELKTIQAEETNLSQHLSRNHLVVCKKIFPNDNPSYVVATYEELYPINLLGHKFLIAHKDYLIAQTTKNMNIASTDLTALGKYAIIKPIIEEEREGELLVPTSAKEKPQTGTVVSIMDHAKVSAGDTVLFRRGAGVEQEIDGESHLIMGHVDIFAKFTPKSGN